MSGTKYDDVNVGDELPEHDCGPVSRTTLALFCGASGDHNPIHVDIDFARHAGMPDVFAHGMLSMAYLGQLLTQWVDPRNLREFGVRFVAITPVLARVTCKARVIEKLRLNDERCVKLELKTQIDDGTTTLIGDAIVAFD